jgi:sialate O-acetylesterase
MKLPPLFGDHMVLQQGAPIPVWGWDHPGQPVKIRLAGQTTETIADANGRWATRLAPLSAGGPYQLLIEGSQRRVLDDVLVGEVWLCSGQSNMQMSLGECGTAQNDLLRAGDSLLRFFSVNVAASFEPRIEAAGRWVGCDPKTALRFSAAAFWYGQYVAKELQIPIGLILAASGDTPAEAWISRTTLEREPKLRQILKRWEESFAKQPPDAESFQRFHGEWMRATSLYGPQEASWLTAAQIERSLGKPLPPRLPKPTGPGSKQSPTVLYNAMIAPLIPYFLRGVIWYQGETNAIQGRSYQYRDLFLALIRSWRKEWGQGDFPFLYVQLANHVDVQGVFEDGSWAELREAQLRVLSEPNVAMAVTIDIGEADRIHPRNKREVGRRLALAALATVYGRPLTYSGPIYDSMEIENDSIRLRFKHVTTGLVVRGEELSGFSLAGTDQRFFPGQARIDGDTVVVSSRQVPKPVAVRYGWADNPACNLCNSDGLPASPFRTDHWPAITADRL